MLPRHLKLDRLVDSFVFKCLQFNLISRGCWTLIAKVHVERSYCEINYILKSLRTMAEGG